MYSTRFARDHPVMAKRGKAYLDGGPANGTVVELDQPNWAPIGALKVTVNGVEVMYVRAPQRDPGPGEPWRYVPQSSVGNSMDADRDSNEDPYDD